MARRAKPWFRKARGAWFVTVEGVQHNLGADKKEAFERFYELMRQPQKLVAPCKSLVEVVDAFLDWVKTNQAADTFAWYHYRLERFCQRYADLRMTELKPYHVQQWVDSVPGLGKTSRRNYLRTVKRCCHWAVQQGYLPENPVRHLEVPSAERRERRITSAEYEQLLTLIPDQALKDLVIVTWETGCRPQESLRVAARHVDLEHQRWVFPKSEAKGKRQPRIIYLSDKALEVTRRRMQQFPEGALFRNSKGREWTPDAVNCAFDRLRIKLLRLHPKFDSEAAEQEILTLTGQLPTNRLVKGQPVELTARQLAAEARRKVQNGATKLVENAYDARGYRIRKDTYTSGTISESRHYYYTPGWQCVEERLDTNTTAERQFVWGLRYIDDLIVRDRSTANNGTMSERRYGMQDGNWNMIAICNTTGSVTERYAYSAYGTPVFMTGAGIVQTGSASDFETLYAGYRWDGGSPQMYYVRNRFLLPVIGTWNRRDPLGYVDGMNLYQNCLCNPTGVIDPLGLDGGLTAAGAGGTLVFTSTPAVPVYVGGTIVESSTVFVATLPGAAPVATLPVAAPSAGAGTATAGTAASTVLPATIVVVGGAVISHRVYNESTCLNRAIWEWWYECPPLEIPIPKPLRDPRTGRPVPPTLIPPIGPGCTSPGTSSPPIEMPLPVPLVWKPLGGDPWERERGPKPKNARNSWSCKAKGATRGGEGYPDDCPDWLYGSGTGSTQEAACTAAKKDANHSKPGCWAGHIRCYDCKKH